MAQATTISGHIIQFNDVKFSFGINNLSTFKNNGKFVCEKKGIYLVSVTMTVRSSDSDSAFCIMHNGFNLCSSSQPDSGYRSYSITIVMNLKINDNVWIIHGKPVVPSYSYFMIIKVN